MAANSNRDNFNSKTRDRLAKRAGFLCSICKILTVGSSKESLYSITNIGVAAHITAASLRGPRYDSSSTVTERTDISNAIWLCQNHAALVDRDRQTWTIQKLKEVKSEHEEYIRKALILNGPIDTPHEKCSRPIISNHYAFVEVNALVEPYKQFIDPILKDKNVGDDFTIGILMCGSKSGNDVKPSWTVLVNSNWLQWMLKGKASNFKIPEEIPREQIYGQIPGWPDSFFEFLVAIIRTNSTFEWRRHQNGYLILVRKN